MQLQDQQVSCLLARNGKYIYLLFSSQARYQVQGPSSEVRSRLQKVILQESSCAHFHFNLLTCHSEPFGLKYRSGNCHSLHGDQSQHPSSRDFALHPAAWMQVRKRLRVQCAQGQAFARSLGEVTRIPGHFLHWRCYWWCHGGPGSSDWSWMEGQASIMLSLRTESRIYVTMA